MSRYIDVDALYDFMNRANIPYNALIQEAIDFQPSISIVRCKDCKYMTEYYDIDGNAPYWTCSEWDSGTDADGFCHHGERSEE